MADTPITPAVPPNNPLTGLRISSTGNVCRGAQRLLAGLGWASVVELPLPNGRRADIVGLSTAGALAIIEVKSCLDDFRTDLKWPEYLDYCDTFYFAVDADFPTDVLPPDTGLIIADRFGAEIVRPSAVSPLKAPRRKQMTALFARAAALRLQHVLDPGAKLDPVMTSW